MEYLDIGQWFVTKAIDKCVDKTEEKGSRRAASVHRRIGKRTSREKNPTGA